MFHMAGFRTGFGSYVERQVGPQRGQRTLRTHSCSSTWDSAERAGFDYMMLRDPVTIVESKDEFPHDPVEKGWHPPRPMKLVH